MKQKNRVDRKGEGMDFWERRTDFEIYKSNICHLVKDMGDLDFIIYILGNDMVRKLYQKKWYPETLYLLAMVDYLSKENDLPICSEYEDLRCRKLSKVIYPSGVIALAGITGDETYKEKALTQAIPEFMRYNIVESEVRNVI